MTKKETHLRRKSCWPHLERSVPVLLYLMKSILYHLLMVREIGENFRSWLKGRLKNSLLDLKCKIDRTTSYAILTRPRGRLLKRTMSSFGETVTYEALPYQDIMRQRMWGCFWTKKSNKTRPSLLCVTYKMRYWVSKVFLCCIYWKKEDLDGCHWSPFLKCVGSIWALPK